MYTFKIKKILIIKIGFYNFKILFSIYEIYYFEYVYEKICYNIYLKDFDLETPNIPETPSQVRIDRRPTVGPTLLKLVRPCWPEVGPTSEMITLSVHWREQQLARTLGAGDGPS